MISAGPTPTLSRRRDRCCYSHFADGETAGVVRGLARGRPGSTRPSCSSSCSFRGSGRQRASDRPLRTARGLQGGAGAAASAGGWLCPAARREAATPTSSCSAGLRLGPAAGGRARTGRGPARPAPTLGFPPDAVKRAFLRSRGRSCPLCTFPGMEEEEERAEFF